MRRTGSWLLGTVAFVVLGGGAWLGLRPYLMRETVFIALVRHQGLPDPGSDGVEAGLKFALEERGHRAGKFRARTVRVDAARASFLGEAEHSPPAVAAVTTCREGECEGEHLLTVAPLGVDEGQPGACFRLLPGLTAQGAAAARWAKSRGVERAFLIRELFDDEINQVVGGFRAEAVRIGLKVLDVDPFHEPVEGFAEEILERKPDLVFFGGEKSPHLKATQIFTALRRKGYQGKLMVADPGANASVLAAPVPLNEGIWIVSSLAPAPADFASRYRAMAGHDPGPFAYYGYLAGLAVLDAIEAAPSKDRADILRASGRDGGSAPANSPALYVVEEGKPEFVELLK